MKSGESLKIVGIDPKNEAIEGKGIPEKDQALLLCWIRINKFLYFMGFITSYFETKHCRFTNKESSHY